jgi:ribonuclease P protein component
VFRIYYQFAPYTKVPGKEYDAPGLLFGVGVGKRHFKRAVDRNRIKRLTREAYRLQKLSLQEAIAQNRSLSLNLFFMFSGKEMPNFETVYQQVGLVLQRMQQLARNFKA